MRIDSEIRVGTSGYSFDDWRGHFYPQQTEKGKMLDFYVTKFPTVEINSTYYRIPHPRVMANLVKKAPQGFDFMVKVPQSFTHRRTDLNPDIAAFADAIRPMIEAGVLSGLLAQFPGSFRFSPESLVHLKICRDAVTPRPLYVEFRHNGWVNRTVYEFLKTEKIGYVCVDEPQIAGLLKPDAFATTDTAYVRLHGRNAAKWHAGGPARYDYYYSDEELEEWRQKIRKLKEKISRLYIYFNNCYEAKAAANALEFMRSLET
jgi:uncharacterized protein YecE (DUF72 family)